MKKRAGRKPKSRASAGSRSRKSTPHAAPDLRPALRAVAKVLTGLKVPSMVIGGVAAIAQGSERVTTDVDATLLIGRLSLESLIAQFLEAGFSGREPALAEFARQTGVVLLRHDRSSVSVDLSLAALAFEERALHRAEVRTLGGIALRVAHPTDLIIYKMVAHRTRDLDDAEAMVRLHRSRISRPEIEAAIDEFSTILEDSAPRDAWREVKRRTGLT